MSDVNWNDDMVYNLTGLPPNGRRGLQRFRSTGRMVLLFLTGVIKIDDVLTADFPVMEISNDNEAY